MRNGEIKNINGSWNQEENAWVSETLCLTGDCYLDITMSDKARLVIKKAEHIEGPYPKALVTRWVNPRIKIRMYGTTLNRYIRIYLTHTPDTIFLSSI